jgi:hypothetical protein
MLDRAFEYVPRKPEETVLCGIIVEQLETFLAHISPTVVKVINPPTRCVAAGHWQGVGRGLTLRPTPSRVYTQLGLILFLRRNKLSRSCGAG